MHNGGDSMKKIKLKLLSLLLVLGAFVVSGQSISAHEDDGIQDSSANVSEKYGYYTCLHWDKEGAGRNWVNLPQSGSDEWIPKGSDVILHIYLNNAEGESANVSLQLLEGLEFMDYTDNVLWIHKSAGDYRYATEKEYEQFKNGGLLTDINKTSTMTFTVRLKTTSSSATEARTQVTVEGAGVKEIKEYTPFYSNYQQIFHHINIYDGQELTNTYKYLEGDTSDLPILEKEGYDFLGYSYSPDGNGDYYHGGEVYSNIDLYAIYQKKTFNVNYYVDGKIYETIIVEYGEDAQSLQIDGGDDRIFKGWDGELSNVTSDRDVYAIFTKKPTPPVIPKPDPKPQPKPDPIEPTPDPEPEPKPTPKPAETVKVKEEVAPVVAVEPVAIIEEVEELVEKKENSKAKIQKTSSVDGTTKTNKNKTKTLYADTDKSTSTSGESSEGSSDTLVATKTVDDNWLNKILPFVISGVGILVLVGMQLRSKFKK